MRIQDMLSSDNEEMVRLGAIMAFSKGENWCYRNINAGKNKLINNMSISTLIYDIEKNMAIQYNRYKFVTFKRYTVKRLVYLNMINVGNKVRSYGKIIV